ncbi:hypothetical protein C5Y93_29825 [Blastopirellula marina]|uniref:Uncharacterized protein n=2 Tax=Blastopirellula marina TaxID=124 RepID=A0A2S8GA80_9BACT|nr:hypothetical protein C5Y93_29825 [Blastopirellula marina]
MHGILSEADAAEMDKKVAESEFAQKLITHIRTRVMRKELSALAVEGDGIGRDANTVAEYLDHKLDPQQVAQLELLCFESDRHLAEVASAHQILTMVLGTPAHVSSSLRKRAYGALGNSMLLKTDSSSDLNQVLTPEDQRWNTTDDAPPEVDEDDEELMATNELPVAVVLPEEDDRPEEEEEDEEELAAVGGSSFGAKGWSLALIVVLALGAGWLIAASGWIAPPKWLTGGATPKVADSSDAETNGPEKTTEPTKPTEPGGGEISRNNVRDLNDITAEPGTPGSPNPTTPPMPNNTGGNAPTSPPGGVVPAIPAGGTPAMTGPGANRNPDADAPFTNVPNPGNGGPNGAPPAAPNPEAVDPSLLEPGRRGAFLIHDIQSDRYFAPPRGAVIKPFQRLIVAPGGYFATTAEDAGDLIIVGPADVLLTADKRVILNYGHISIPATENPISLEVVGGPSITLKNNAADGEVNIDVDRFMSGGMKPSSLGWMKIYSAGQCEIAVGDVTVPLFAADELILYTNDEPVLNRRKLAPSWSVLYASPAADFVRMKMDEGARQGVDALITLRRLAESNVSAGVRSEAMRLSAEAGQIGPLVQSFQDPTLSQFWSAHFHDLAEIWARAEPNEKTAMEGALHGLSPQFGELLVKMLDSYWRDELTQQEAVELIVNLDHHETPIRLFAFESLQRMTGYTLLYRPDMTKQEREGPITRWWGRLSAGQLAGQTATRAPK